MRRDCVPEVLFYEIEAIDAATGAVYQVASHQTTTSTQLIVFVIRLYRNVDYSLHFTIPCACKERERVESMEQFWLYNLTEQ